MNFKELQQAEKPYDELMVIGKNIEKQGQLYHIAGMTRCGTEAVLYVLEQESLIKKDKNKKDIFFTHLNAYSFLKNQLH